MEENLQNNDNLASFFKSSFDYNDEYSSSGDWDKPADDVWEKIEKELPGESPEKVIYLPKIITRITAALLFLLVGISLFLYFQNKNLNRVIQQQNQIVKEISKDKSREDHSSFPIKKEETITIQPALEENTPMLSERTKQTSTPEPPISIDRNKSPNSSPVKVERPTIAKEKYISDKESGKKVKLLVQKNKIVAQIPVIEAIITRNDTPPIPLNYQLAKSTFTRTKKQSAFFVGVFLAPSYSGKRVNTISTHSTLPFRGREVTKVGTNWGLKVGFHINEKWDLITGISRISATQIQRSRLFFNHQSANEHQEDNEYVSSYSLSVSSSYGESDAAVEIVRPNNQPLTDQVVPLSFTLKQKISFLSLPLLIQHHKKIGRFNLSFMGGIAINFLDKFESKILISSLRHNFRARPVRSVKNPILDNKTSLNFVTGFGLSYDINKHFSLSIEPQIQKNIRPFVKNSQFQSSFYVAGVQMGGYWNF